VAATGSRASRAGRTTALPPVVSDVTGPTFPLVTDRLRLRPFSVDDLDAVYRLESRADVMRYLNWEPRTLDESRASLERRLTMTAIDEERGALRLAVLLKDSEELIGDLSLWLRSREHRQGEIGFMFHPAHQGRGYATEAATAVLGIGFETFGLHRISGSCDARNMASARLMERLGMRLEGTLRETEYVKGAWCDELIYAMRADEWHDRVSASIARAAPAP
jgi:RimJ/RimL family protein N-acetyltransferase